MNHAWVTENGTVCKCKKRSSDKNTIFLKVTTRHLYICTKDYPRIDVLNQKDESISIKRVSWVSIGILGQVWCLIVSIPDICPLSYFKRPLRTYQVGRGLFLGLSLSLLSRFVYVGWKTLARLHLCAGWSKHSLLTGETNFKILCAGPYAVIPHKQPRNLYNI